jgi:dipeptidyl aminopeptidase/acylaminoacyl peptidase
MKFSVLAGIAALTVFSQAAAPVRSPQPRQPKQYSIEQFLSTTAINGASFSADESRILFSSNKTGIWNAYTMPVTGGEWTPITASTTDSTYAVSFFPHDERILLTHDQGGNELNHLYVRAANGELRDLTPGEKVKATFNDWAPDGSAFYVETNERDPKLVDIYRYDSKTYERTLLFENKEAYRPVTISPDGKWLALVKVNTTNDDNLYLWNATTKAATLITKHQGQVSYSAEDFDAASANLYYTTDEGGEFARLRRYNIATGTHADVEKADWDIQVSKFSRTGKYRATIVNKDARPEIAIYETDSNRKVPVPPIPNAGINSITFARSEKKAAMYINGDRSPNDLYVFDFDTRRFTKLTSSLNPEIDPADLVNAEIVRFKARDGMTIPNVLLKPQQASASNKAPALVFVHGGPGGQTTPAYSALVQYLVNHGYVLLGINNRGSSGYGKTFYAADDKKHGREPLWDCVDAKKYLQTLEYVDPDRIAIIGGSYGGYMVLAALAFQPSEFAAGVDLFGVANWIRTLDSMPSWWEAQRLALYAEMGDPVADRVMLEEVSPLLHADRIRKPLIVLQGANDPRVLKVESDEVVAAVKKNGVPVEYIVFPDEGHGFTKKKNQIEGYSAVLKFLDRYVKGTPGTR